MGLKNINSNPRFTKHLVASQTFVSKPIIVVDVGARGGFESHWDFYRDQIKLNGFEADEKECERLNQKASNSRNHFFPAVLDQNSGKKIFYITTLPASSGFYLPDISFLQRIQDGVKNLSVVNTLEMDTINFDSFASENHIDPVDFIKLDTEGSELDILKGAIKSLRKSVIGLSIEVEFLPIHKNQPVFSDVDSFLRPLGFKLFDLAIYQNARKVLPVKNLGQTHIGQVLWGQALYLRDGVEEIEGISTLGDGWNDVRILKLASIMELFCLHDCAIELIQVAFQKDFLQDRNVNNLVDMLVPSVRGKNVSYNEYLNNIYHPNIIIILIRSGKQLLRKVIPAFIRHIIHNCLIKFKDLIDEIVS